MGCGGSKNIEVDEAARRRLSVGAVDKDGEEEYELAEEERGMVTGVSTANVIEMLSAADKQSNRKFSVGSQTDAAKTSFANKTIQQLGDEIDQHGLGYTCRKGLKPESPNQDSWFVLKVDGNFSLYGVFDGHGSKGHDVSNFVKENLPKLIIKDPRLKSEEQPKMLVEAFKKCQQLVISADRLKKLNAQMSGTTCTVAIQDHTSNKLTISHVANSTGVLGRYIAKDRKVMEAVKLTREHKPDLPDERARIESNGGRVAFDGFANHRVYAKKGRYPGLNMSRCLGDILGHRDTGISCEPEVTTLTLTELDHILLLCSDGVWEFVTPEEAVSIVSEFPPQKAMIAAEKLAKESWDRWIRQEGGTIVDDITVVLVYLNAP